ncbi:hypothetical protein SAMN05444682_115109 [Parapedobacter indicus]|uniref:Uncharacterized protein n=1 Tax=Parapedobacter indicus TaxID=1477437 RepID=A0A1I3V1C1_9SPHI|nr:hypothetical protein CLV26_11569 [Parapedobacter indicus]SFJ87941.1 hypothetical protein SAMN05444682_115109 [Parapedobacter indicus]
MSNLRIVYVRGDEPIRPKNSKSKFKQEVDDFIKLFVEDHNRKFQSCKS